MPLVLREMRGQFVLLCFLGAFDGLSCRETHTEEMLIRPSLNDSMFVEINLSMHIDNYTDHLGSALSAGNI